MPGTARRTRSASVLAGAGGSIGGRLRSTEGSSGSQVMTRSAERRPVPGILGAHRAATGTSTPAGRRAATSTLAGRRAATVTSTPAGRRAAAAANTLAGRWAASSPVGHDSDGGSPELQPSAFRQLHELVREAVQEMLPGTHAEMDTRPDTRIPAGFSAATDPGPALEPGTGTPRGPHTLASSISASTRQKIIEHKYVDLGGLLDLQEHALDQSGTSLQLVNGVLSVTPRAPRTINSFGVWCAAFIRYASVYLGADPANALGLMTHMQQVSQLAAPGLGFAWREFDRLFRQAREVDPVGQRWGETAATSQMWLQAIAAGIGGTARGQQSGRVAEVGSFRICYAFNSQRGCRLRECRYRHACRACRGPHPVQRCPNRAARSRGRAEPASSGAHQ